MGIEIDQYSLDGDLSASTDTFNGRALARFPAISQTRRNGVVRSMDALGYSTFRLVDTIKLEVPMTRESPGVVGRRVSLVDRTSSCVLYEGIVGWA